LNADTQNKKSITDLLLAKKHILILSLIVVFAAIIRSIFFCGLVFSDDSYYNWLAYQYNTSPNSISYLGYPILLIRKLSLLFTVFSYNVIGYNEKAGILFPFIFSLLSIILIYKITLNLFKNKRISLTAAFLTAFMPVDVIFASINFSDLACVFFINIGIYFFIRAVKEKKNHYSIYAGLFLSLSILIKEYAYYYCIILFAVFVFSTVKKEKYSYKYIFPVLIVICFLFIEGFFYKVLNNSFFYRLRIFQDNYRYCYYDFFPYTLTIGEVGFNKYIIGLFKHILINIKYILIRRYYVALPLLSIVQSYFLFKKKEQQFLLIWFWGLLILLPMMTVSLSTYAPIELRRTWYIYPLIFPCCILSASLLSRLKPVYFKLSLGVFLICSVLMSVEFQKFFDVHNNNLFKQFIRIHPEKIIYTDHHTAYGIRLIQEYKTNEQVKLLTNTNSLNVKQGELVVYSKPVIDELKKQNYFFPDFTRLTSENYKLIDNFGQFEVFEKIK
jgi:4-amino-4-deoxy-L-arabinose transferase-like glycosyltransferase